MNTTPIILLPRQTRSGIRYKKLSHHFFSSEEMIWIVRNLISDNDVRTATTTWDQISFDAYFTRYGIPTVVLHDWVDMYLRGEDLVAGLPTVSSTIDVIGERVITRMVTTGRLEEESQEAYENRVIDAIELEMRGTLDRQAFVCIDKMSF